MVASSLEIFPVELMADMMVEGDLKAVGYFERLYPKNISVLKG